MSVPFMTLGEILEAGPICPLLHTKRNLGCDNLALTSCVTSSRLSSSKAQFLLACDKRVELEPAE